MQAVLAAFLHTTWMKVLSGRRGPLHVGEGALHARPFEATLDFTDVDFHFWDHSLSDRRFFWPSGHTATAIALVGYPIAALVGFSMIDGDHHGASDVVAGALIGHVIGWAIAARFRAASEA